jgi:hypothetical protein
LGIEAVPKLIDCALKAQGFETVSIELWRGEKNRYE